VERREGSRMCDSGGLGRDAGWRWAMEAMRMRSERRD